MNAKAALLALACLAASPAWAINKCTGADGKVVFQDAPCNTATQKAETVKTWDNNLTGRSRAGAWESRRVADEMTGETTCLVVSPATSVEPQRGDSKFIPVNLAISVSPTGNTFAVRSSRDRDLFHNDLSGMGVKLDNLEFMPLDIKGGQHIVGSSKEKEILEALPLSKNVRLRLRFWPYDALRDTLVISTSGFQVAYAQAKRCAGISD